MVLSLQDALYFQQEIAAVSLITAYLAIMKTSTAGNAIPKWSWYKNFFDVVKSQFF